MLILALNACELCDVLTHRLIDAELCAAAQGLSCAISWTIRRASAFCRAGQRGGCWILQYVSKDL